MTTSEIARSEIPKPERTWAMFAHLSSFLFYTCIPLANIIAPLIIWQIKKEDMPFASDQGKECLNFQISMLIYIIISSILTLILIGVAFMDHRWRFLSVRGGLSLTLYASGSAPANAEGDDFEIEFSTNAGSSWSSFSPPVVITNGSATGSEFIGAFPAGTQGNIDLRIIDTDATQGNREFDLVNVDQLFIRTDIDPNDFPPVAPDLVTATAVSASEVDITWQDNSSNEVGFAIYRSTDSVNWLEIANVVANSSSYRDTSASPATSYRYQVGAYSPSFESLSVESNVVTTPDGLSLGTLSGGKSKGAIYVDLTWAGGASLGEVIIWRSLNGGAFVNILTTANDFSQRDETGLKGGQTLTYEVRSPNGSIKSNQQTISF